MSTAPLEKIIRSILRPGFPGLLHAPSDIAARSMESHIKDIATTDLNRLANLRSEPAVIEQLITSLARATTSEVPSQHCARTYHGRYPHRRRPSMRLTVFVSPTSQKIVAGAANASRKM